MPRHENNGNCRKCEEIFNTFPAFDIKLKSWFKEIQKCNPEAHISDAGRGKEKQEEYFNAGRSLAHYGKSAHNYNAAIDIFKMEKDSSGKFVTVYKEDWYNQVVLPKLNSYLSWLGSPEEKEKHQRNLKRKRDPNNTEPLEKCFYELPHVQIKDWKLLVLAGKLKLVE